jgi:hypothetical protein
MPPPFILMFPTTEILASYKLALECFIVVSFLTTIHIAFFPYMYMSFTSCKLPPMYYVFFCITSNLYHGRWACIGSLVADPGQGEGCGAMNRVSQADVTRLLWEFGDSSHG